MATPNLFAASVSTPGLLVAQQLTATTETVVYTVPAGKSARLAQGSLCNTSAAAVVVSLSLVPAAGTVGDGTHKIIANYSLAAGDTLPLGDYLGGHLLGDGDRITATAATAGVVDVVISGAVTG